MDRCLQRSAGAVLALGMMVGLTGCESNGGLRVAGVGEYSLGSAVEGTESFIDDGLVGEEGTMRLASVDADLLGSTAAGASMLSRAGNVAFGAAIVQGTGVPDGATTLLRTAATGGIAPGRSLASATSPAAGIVSGVVAPILATVANNATSPLGAVTAPALSATTAAAGAVTGTVGAAVASVDSIVGAVPATTSATTSALAGLTAPVASATAGTVAASASTAVAAVDSVVAAAPAVVAASAPAVQSIAANVLQASQPVAAAAVAPVTAAAGGLLGLGR